MPCKRGDVFASCPLRICVTIGRVCLSSHSSEHSSNDFKSMRKQRHGSVLVEKEMLWALKSNNCISMNQLRTAVAYFKNAASNSQSDKSGR